MSQLLLTTRLSALISIFLITYPKRCFTTVRRVTRSKPREIFDYPKVAPPYFSLPIIYSGRSNVSVSKLRTEIKLRKLRNSDTRDEAVTNHRRYLLLSDVVLYRHYREYSFGLREGVFDDLTRDRILSD